MERYISHVEELNKNFPIEKGVYMTVSPKGYANKKAMEEGLKYEGHKAFSSMNLGRTTHLKVGFNDFVRFLRRGHIHIMADYIGTGHTKKGNINQASIRINMLCYDFDCGEKIDKKTGEPYETNPTMMKRFKELGSVEKLENELKQHFQVIQRSNSWTEEAPRYHAYKLLNGEITDLKHALQVYKHYSKEIKKALHFQPDEVITPIRPMYAGQPNNLIINNTLLPFSIPQVEDILKEINSIENKILQEKNHNPRIYEIKDGFNYEALYNALIELPKQHDFNNWKALVLGITNMYDEGIIDESQAEELLELLDNEEGGSVEFFHKAKGIGYGNTYGTIHHYLTSEGIDTSQIFKRQHEKEEFNRDKVILFSESHLGKNKEIVEEVRKVLRMKGKRILLIAPTGAGKSFVIMQELHNLYSEGRGLMMFTVPRTKLKENQIKDFVTTDKALALDGTQVANKEIPYEIIDTKEMFLSTYDYAPAIIDRKEGLQNELEAPNNVLVTDEIHMLYTDTSFKVNQVKEYVEKGINYFTSDLNGAVVDVTATPQYLDMNNYDYIVEFKRDVPTYPFNYPCYCEISNKNKESYEQMLSALLCNDTPVLAFIENKNIIQEYAEVLKAKGKKVVTITSESPLEVENLKPSHGMSEEDVENIKSIVLKGIIPQGVDTILATSTIGAGVSIINNSSDWQTWVLANRESLNTCPIPIIQYANRLRNQYDKLIIFIPYRENGQEKEYPLHRKAQEGYLEALKVQDSMEKLREELNAPMIYTKFEREYGLYYDWQTKVLKEAVYNRYIQERKYYNLSNPKCLINYLQRAYDIPFLVIQLEGDIVQEAKDLTTKKLGKVEQKKAVVKEFKENPAILKEIVEKGGASTHYEEVINALPKREASNLSHAVYLDLPLEIVSQVIKSKGDFKKDLEAYTEIKSVSLAGNTVNPVLRYLEARGVFGMEFNSKADLYAYIDKLLIHYSTETGIALAWTGKAFDKYLVMEENKTTDRSNGKKKDVRKYRYIGVKDEMYLENTYGYNPLTSVF